ncbi:hypothetical protein ACP70R_041960 [Stipagrostis hirtigluma subsp. patula]
MATTTSGSRKRWNTKQYIFAALLGLLVAVVAIAGISISLAPAHISFSIASATISNRNDTGNTAADRYYNFTLVASTTSGHTSVSYRHLTAEIWYSPTGWVPIEVNLTTTTALRRWQRPGSKTAVPILAMYGQFSEATRNATMEGGAGWPNSRVVVEAKVLFRFGLTTTTPYTVRASCWPVNFLNNTATHFPVDCSS